jgi:hypothetical protein
MAATVYTGSYAVFYSTGSSTATATGVYMNSTQIDNLYAGKVPTSSGTVVTAWTWKRLFTSADDSATLSREGTTLDLKTQEEGLRGVVATDPDKYVLEIPVADIIAENFRKFLNINSAYHSSSGTIIPINTAEVGIDSMDYGVPMLIMNKKYATNTDMDVPTFTDPNAWCFINGGLADRNFTVNLNPKAQQIFNVRIAFSQESGTSYSLAGCFGALTASS